MAHARHEREWDSIIMMVWEPDIDATELLEGEPATFRVVFARAPSSARPCELWTCWMWARSPASARRAGSGTRCAGSTACGPSASAARRWRCTTRSWHMVPCLEARVATMTTTTTAPWARAASCCRGQRRSGTQPPRPWSGRRSGTSGLVRRQAQLPQGHRQLSHRHAHPPQAHRQLLHGHPPQARRQLPWVLPSAPDDSWPTTPVQVTRSAR